MASESDDVLRGVVRVLPCVVRGEGDAAGGGEPSCARGAQYAVVGQEVHVDTQRTAVAQCWVVGDLDVRAARHRITVA
jgi:hypothetical protein